MADDPLFFFLGKKEKFKLLEKEIHEDDILYQSVQWEKQKQQRKITEIKRKYKKNDQHKKKDHKRDNQRTRIPDRAAISQPLNWHDRS